VADLIEKAVIEVDLNEQRESIDQSYRYTLCDGEGNPVDAQMIKTNTEEVRAQVKIRRMKDVKLLLDVTYGGGANKNNTKITLDTDSIRVSGSEAALDALGDSITLGKINLAEIPRGQQIPFTISLPEGVTNETGITEVEATVKFSGLSLREFSLEDIRSVHVPEGVRVEIITEKITVILRGPTAEMSRIDESDLHAVVDFSTAVVGESSTIYAEIVLEGNNGNVGPIGTYTVLATVEEI
jgi:YbbR domain-containing protein